MTARWLDIAWADEGVCEIAGPGAELKIVQYFREAGRPEITSNETPWCAAFVAACLSQAGIAPTLPSAERLLARAYLKVGTPIDKPRSGCIAVLMRGDPSGYTGRVGFVVGEAETHIALLGGNQANAVNVRHFPKGHVLGYRWPETVTAAQLDKAVSRITAGARQQQVDATIATGSQVIPSPPVIDPHALVGKGVLLQGTVEGAIGFMNFLSMRWPYLMGGVALYYVGRMVWTSGLIRAWRAEDASTGATTSWTIPISAVSRAWSGILMLYRRTGVRRSRGLSGDALTQWRDRTRKSHVRLFKSPSRTPSVLILRV